jgi:hypothetical protein
MPGGVVVVVSGAHVSIAPAAWGSGVMGGSFRRRISITRLDKTGALRQN